MRNTDFNDLLDTKATVSTESGSVAYGVSGTAIGADDVKALGMAEYQYRQLTQADDTKVVKAGERASLHMGVVFARLGKTLNLDDLVHRAIVVNWTVYELHMALGHEEAGREWRIKAKDLIISFLGAYPESSQPQEGSAAVGALAVPRPRRYAPYDTRSYRCH